MIVGIVSSNTFPTPPTITISPSTIQTPTLTVPYSQIFSASGGYAPYTWSLTGTLPEGISFNASTATLSGTTSQSVTVNFTVTVVDAGGYTVSNNYTFVVGRVTSFDYVVIGGGGGGGGSTQSQTYTTAGGGGGAGGYLTGSLSTASLSTLDVVVGIGGDGGFQLSTVSMATSGGESAILNNSNYLVKATGGGWGALGTILNNWSNGGDGASGGGACSASTTNRGVSGARISSENGNFGGVGAALSSARTDVGAGGGGGAGGPGSPGALSSGGSGGTGAFDGILGYVCAGGSGGYTTNHASGATSSPYPGSGGAGARFTSSTVTRARGQPGAPGKVVISYPLINLAATVSGSVTYSESNNKRIYTFTGPGTIAF